MKKMKILFSYMLLIVSIFCLAGCEPAPAEPYPAESADFSSAGQQAAGPSYSSSAAASRTPAPQTSSKNPPPMQPPEKTELEKLYEAHPEVRELQLETLGSGFRFYTLHQYGEITVEAAAYECYYDEFKMVLVVYDDFIYVIQPAQLYGDVGINDASFRKTDLDHDGTEELLCILNFGEDFSCESLYVLDWTEDRCEAALLWQTYCDRIPSYATESLQDGVVTIRTQTNSASFAIYPGITNQERILLDNDGTFCIDEQTGEMYFCYYAIGYCGSYFWDEFDHDGYYIYGEVHIPIQYDGAEFHWGQSELVMYDEVQHTPAKQRNT